MTRYPLDALYEEVAFIAFHFHWNHATVLELDHRERRRWVEEISKINRKLSEETPR
jgi:HD superfamily phosphodiesterase